MKIALIAPLYEAVPPRLYGGTERVVAYLANALVDLGHDVTLFASGDSSTRARLVACRNRAIRLDERPLKSDLAAHLAMLDEVRRRAAQFDVLHFHMDLMHFPFFESIASRTLTTLHGRLDLVDLKDAYARWPQYALVSISDRQREALPHANWAGTVHHGIPGARDWPAARAGAGYLAFLGRISPEKRLDRAIRIAQRAGMPLRIAAKIDQADRAYFESEIKHMLDAPGIEFIGEIGDAEKPAFLGNAAALLFPIDWPEPFGLVVIEAMACGTPVIAWDCGAVREIVEEGGTGFIVRSEVDAVAAVGHVSGLDRARIRRTFERRFSASTMARKYVQIYQRLAQHGRGAVLAASRTEAA